LMSIAGGAVAAAMLTLVCIALDKYQGTDKAIVVTIVAVLWAIAGGIAGGNKQRTVYALATGGAGLVALTAVFAAIGELSPLTGASLFGAGPGAILGAIGGVVVERRRIKAGSLVARGETAH